MAATDPFPKSSALLAKAIREAEAEAFVLQALRTKCETMGWSADKTEALIAEARGNPAMCRRLLLPHGYG